MGAISKEKLFHLWGLDSEGRPKLRNMMYNRAQTVLHPFASKENSRLPTAHSIALEDLTDKAKFRPSWEVDPKGSTVDPSNPVPKSMLKIKSKEVISFLRDKVNYLFIFLIFERFCFSIAAFFSSNLRPRRLSNAVRNTIIFHADR